MGSAQACLQANNENAVPPASEQELVGGRSNVIPWGSQAIIPSYTFNCSGNITQWEVALSFSQLEEQTDDFVMELQVWRSLDNVDNNSMQRYSILGHNNCTVRSESQVATCRLSPLEPIEFAPGDVLGFRLWNPSTESEDNEDRETTDQVEETSDTTDYSSTDDDDDDENSSAEMISGVMIIDEINGTMSREEVWYALINNEFDTADSDRTVSIGPTGKLNILTMAAPLIAVAVNTTAAGTRSIQNQTHQNEFHTSMSSIPPVISTQESSAVTREARSSNGLISVIATSVPVILVIISITMVALVGTCLVRRRRRAKILNLARTTSDSCEAQEEYDDIVSRSNYKGFTQNGCVTQAVREGFVATAFFPATTQQEEKVLAKGMKQTPTATRGNNNLQDSSHKAVVSLDQANSNIIVVKMNEAYGQMRGTNDTDDYDYPHVYY